MSGSPTQQHNTDQITILLIGLGILTAVSFVLLARGIGGISEQIEAIEIHMGIVSDG